jgi:hypothetical protein
MVLRAQAATSSPDASTLRQCLHFGDPQQVAYAASLAGSKADLSLLAELPAILGARSLPQNEEGRRATEVILDTLIQQHVSTPLSVIESVSFEYPAQAAVLITRLPFPEAVPTLLRWSSLGDARGSFSRVPTGDANGIRLARVAVSVLASNPKATIAAEPAGAPNFVGNLVSASELSLAVEVFPPDQPHGGLPGGLLSCRDYDDVFHPEPAPLAMLGWPPVYTYRLQEEYSSPQPESISIPGEDGLIVRRILADHPDPGCFRVKPLDQDIRHRAIASWLGLKPGEMKWQPLELPGIAWTDQKAYEAQLGAITNSAFKRLRATTHALEQKGLLNHWDAGIVTPRLTVQVLCRISPCPIASD